MIPFARLLPSKKKKNVPFLKMKLPSGALYLPPSPPQIKEKTALHLQFSLLQNQKKN